MNRLTWSERHHNALCKLWNRAQRAGNINDRKLMRRIEIACNWLHARSLRKCNRPQANRNGRTWPEMQMKT